MQTAINSAPKTSAKIMRNNHMILDLRHKPTRKDFGLPPGKNTTAFQRASGVPAIETTVVLPTGTVRIPAFDIAIDSGDLLTTVEQPPRKIVVQRVFATPRQALESLSDDAPALGISPSSINRLGARVSPTVGTPMPQQGVIDGLVDDWLAVYIEVIGYGDGTVGVNYHFTIDQFHNPVVDNIVHNGIYELNLTRRPSRAELGFKPGDLIGRVGPAWNETMAINLILPTGSVRRPISSVSSSDAVTGIDLSSSDTATARRILTEDSQVLGLAQSSIDRIFTAAPGFQTVKIPGTSTPIYNFTADVDVNVGQPGEYAATVSYTFVYRSPPSR
jgi:hypothetical protein